MSRSPSLSSDSAACRAASSPAGGAARAVATPPPADAPPPADVPPRRQARALATRERILRAAAEDFAAVGYHGSSLSRILERSAGVTKGALYFHFASKEAMARSVLEEAGDAHRRLVDRFARDDGAADPLRRAAALAAAGQDLLARSVVARAGVRLALDGAVPLAEEPGSGGARSARGCTPWLAAWTALFAEARERGDARAEVEPEGAARLALDVCRGAFATATVEGCFAELADRVGQHWDVLLGGVGTSRWLGGWRAEGGMAVALERATRSGVGEEAP